MRFFRLIKSEIDVVPLLKEICTENAWLAHVSRRDVSRVRHGTNTVFLRSALTRGDIDMRENQEVRSTIVSKSFPLAVMFMEAFAVEMGASLERACIVCMEPHSFIERHIDVGSYCFLRDRFHLVLSSANGSVLVSGDEQVRMLPGELWWFDNKQYSWAKNDSSEWQIHYIFDMLSDGLKDLAINPLPIEYNPIYESSTTQNSVPEVPLQNSDRRRHLLHAIRDEAVLRDFEQMLASPSGRRNTWLIDMRRILTNPIHLDAAAELFWEMNGSKFPFQIGGMEASAIPLLAAIQIKSVVRGKPINAFIVRKERKTYGTGSLIEGRLTEDSIIIIDDILNSGESMEKTRAVLDTYGRAIAEIFVIINYQSLRGLGWLRENGFNVMAPFTLADFGLRVERKENALPLRPILRRVWTFASSKPSFFHRVPKSFPVSDGERVFFGSDSGIFWALDAVDGSVQWQFKVCTSGNKNIWSAPAIHDGSIYFGGYDGNVYCLDTKTGAEKWRFTEADWVGSSPALAPDLGLLFIGLEFASVGRQGAIAALDLSSGSKIWEQPTKRYTHASPAYWRERGLVACGSNDDELFLFDASSGAIHWRFQTRGEGRKGSIRHAPAFDSRRGHIIAGCADGYIYIVDISSGNEVWSIRTANDVYTIPLCVDNLAFVGSTDKYLYVLDLDRREVKAKIDARSKIYAPPRLLGDAVYFGACNGLIYKVDPFSAEVIGTHQLPDAITNAIEFSAEANLFYVLTYVNELFALAPI